MKALDVGGKKVVECPHCKGTGMCARAEVAFISKTKASLLCQHCGEGEHFTYSQEMSPQEMARNFGTGIPRPLCKVCEGKGYTVP